MATIKISDLAQVTALTDSEMSYVELTKQELESVLGGNTATMPGDSGVTNGVTKAPCIGLGFIWCF